MKMVISLFFGQMLVMVFTGPMGRIRVVNHIDTDARLTSPDFCNATLDRLIPWILMVLIASSTGSSGRRIGAQLMLLLMGIMGVLQGEVRLVGVEVEVDLMLRHEIDVGANRRDRGRWV